MSYEKQTFVNEITDEKGNIVQEGTVLTAEHLQHIEDGIADAEKFDSVERVTLAEGEKMDLFDLPAVCVATGIFTLPEATGTGINTDYEGIYGPKQPALEINLQNALILNHSSLDDEQCREYKILIFDNTSGIRDIHQYLHCWTSGVNGRDYSGTVREDKTFSISEYRDVLYGIGDIDKYIYDSGNFGTLSGNVDWLNDRVSKLEGEEYELITRKTFDELDLLNSNIPEGKTEAWREKTIKFNKPYKAVMFMLYFDKQDDLGTTRDIVNLFNGDKGGMCYLGIAKIMSSEETRYTRGKVERKNGLWWLEYTEPTKAKGNMVNLRSTQTGFGFAAERIDAEDGIVDAAHLSKNENITSWTIQLTMPANSKGRHNPAGAVAVFGIPAK